MTPDELRKIFDDAMNSVTFALRNSDLHTGQFVLDGHTPVPEPDLKTWALWFGTANRKVNETVVGGYRVSTVFLGHDHNFSRTGAPVLFETMVFHAADIEEDEPLEYCMRCATWEEAEAMHEDTVRQVKAYIEKHADISSAQHDSDD